MAWRAGSNCRRRLGSWSNGGIGDCETGETGTVEADEVGAEGRFNPEADDVEGVVQVWDRDLSKDSENKGGKVAFSKKTSVTYHVSVTGNWIPTLCKMSSRDRF